MHDEQIYLPVDCHFDDGFACVDGCSDPCHSSVVLQLEPVEGIRVVLHFPNLQEFIQEICRLIEASDRLNRAHAEFLCPHIKLRAF